MLYQVPLAPIQRSQLQQMMTIHWLMRQLPHLTILIKKNLLIFQIGSILLSAMVDSVPILPQPY